MGKNRFHDRDGLAHIRILPRALSGGQSTDEHASTWARGWYQRGSGIFITNVAKPRLMATLDWPIKGWSDLDSEKRHCIMDTMVLRIVCRDSDEITGQVNHALAGCILLIVPQTINEATALHERIDLQGRQTDPYFEDCLLARLAARVGTFEVAYPEQETRKAAYKMQAAKKYVSKDNVPLSYVDCVLLLLLKGNPNMDMMTEDATLIRAVYSECGFIGRSRIRRVMGDYSGRRINMIKAIQNIIRRAALVKLRDAPRGTEYVVGNSWVVAVSDQDSDLGVRIYKYGSNDRPDPFQKIPHAVDLIRAFWTFEAGGYCRCGDSKGEAFRCECEDARYDGDVDAGLDEPESRKFLYSLPSRQRKALLSLVSRFESFPYALRGNDRQMRWPPWDAARISKNVR